MDISAGRQKTSGGRKIATIALAGVVGLLLYGLVWQWNYLNSLAGKPHGEDVTPEERERLLNELAGAAILECCSNSIVGLTRIVSIHHASYDARSTNWLGDATCEYASRLGGFISRTNLQFTLRPRNYGLGNKPSFVSCRIDVQWELEQFRRRLDRLKHPDRE